MPPPSSPGGNAQRCQPPAVLSGAVRAVAPPGMIRQPPQTFLHLILPAPAALPAPTRCASSVGRGSQPCCIAPPSRRHGTAQYCTARNGTAGGSPPLKPALPPAKLLLLACPLLPSPAGRDGTGRERTERPSRSLLSAGVLFLGGGNSCLLSSYAPRALELFQRCRAAQTGNTADLLRRKNGRPPLSHRRQATDRRLLAFPRSPGGQRTCAAHVPEGGHQAADSVQISVIIRGLLHVLISRNLSISVG